MKKMKRYEEGGDIDYTTDEEGNEVAISRKNYATGVRGSTDKAEAPARKKAAKAKSDDREDDDSYNRKELRTRDTDTRGTMARSGRMGFRREAPSEEQKQRNAERFADTAMTGIGAAMGAGAIGAGVRAGAKEAARNIMRNKQREMFGSTSAARKFAEAGGMKKGGSVSSASKRADGIAQRGKTKGRVL